MNETVTSIGFMIPFTRLKKAKKIRHICKQTFSTFKAKSHSTKYFYNKRGKCSTRVGLDRLHINPTSHNNTEANGICKDHVDDK